MRNDEEIPPGQVLRHGGVIQFGPSSEYPSSPSTGPHPRRRRRDGIPAAIVIAMLGGLGAGAVFAGMAMQESHALDIDLAEARGAARARIFNAGDGIQMVIRTGSDDGGFPPHCDMPTAPPSIIRAGYHFPSAKTCNAFTSVCEKFIANGFVCDATTVGHTLTQDVIGWVNTCTCEREPEGPGYALVLTRMQPVPMQR